LSIFDNKGEIYIEVDEANYPDQGKELIYYLRNMMKDPIVVRNLEYERLLNEEMEDERIMVKKLKKELITKEKNAVLNLHKEGLSISKLASAFSISEEEVRNYILEK